MKSLCIALSFLICLTFARGQDMDKELASLAEKLAVSIKEHGVKKIAVLDFTDLQDGENELGKYIAEELTVSFVLVKRDFAVLDRANLAKILAEHKLTAKGLVDPENAKKLGEFAGVDGLVMGKIIPKGQTIGLLARVTKTDSSEVAGGGRAEFKSDETVKDLMSRTVASPKDDATSDTNKSKSLRVRKTVGDMAILLEHLTFSNSREGVLKLDLIFRNTSKTKSIAVAMSGEASLIPTGKLRASLSSFDGTECNPLHENDVTGLFSLGGNPSRLTEIKPGEEIRPSMTFTPIGGWSPELPGIRLQCELVMNSDYKRSQYSDYHANWYTLPPGCVVQDVVIEIPFTHLK